jgi:flagellar biosynthesis/type III secretory pathway protein FliH
MTSEFGKEANKMRIMNLWERLGYAEGEEKGREEGIKEGEEKGALLMLLRFLRRKFGEIPSDLVSRLESLRRPEQLEAVMDSAIVANTLEDIELPEVP